MEIYIGGVKVPVNPKDIKITENHKIEVIEVLNAGEVPIPGFTELQNISFQSFIPSVKDGNYNTSSYDPNSFINTIRQYKNDNEPIQVLITGVVGSSVSDGNVNQEYLIESFEYSTEYGYHNDIKYSISLKQYKELKPRKLRIDEAKEQIINPPQEVEETREPVSEEPKVVDESSNYTVVKGDCLWAIARTQYGDGARWKEIYEANKGKIEDPHWIFPGQEFSIP